MTLYQPAYNPHEEGIQASSYTSDKIHLPVTSFGRVSPKTRQRAAERGEAMPDGSFPIRDGADLRRAIKAYGRAKDKGAAKRHIIRRAKALDKLDVLPAAWRETATQEFSHVAVEKKAAESPSDRTLREKLERHNAKNPEDKHVTLPKLRAVYKRGLTSFAAQNAECLTSDQWANARVNSFLRLLSNGTPDCEAYVDDNDLLPQTHPIIAAGLPKPFIVRRVDPHPDKI